MKKCILSAIAALGSIRSAKAAQRIPQAGLLTRKLGALEEADAYVVNDVLLNTFENYPENKYFVLRRDKINAKLLKKVDKSIAAKLAKSGLGADKWFDDTLASDWGTELTKGSSGDLCVGDLGGGAFQFKSDKIESLDIEDTRLTQEGKLNVEEIIQMLRLPKLAETSGGELGRAYDLMEKVTCDKKGKPEWNKLVEKDILPTNSNSLWKAYGYLIAMTTVCMYKKSGAKEKYVLIAQTGYTRACISGCSEKFFDTGVAEKEFNSDVNKIFSETFNFTNTQGCNEAKAFVRGFDACIDRIKLENSKTQTESLDASLLQAYHAGNQADIQNVNFKFTYLPHPLEAKLEAENMVRNLETHGKEACQLFDKVLQGIQSANEEIVVVGMGSTSTQVYKVKRESRMGLDSRYWVYSVKDLTEPINKLMIEADGGTGLMQVGSKFTKGQKKYATAFLFWEKFHEAINEFGPMPVIIRNGGTYQWGHDKSAQSLRAINIGIQMTNLDLKHVDLNIIPFECKDFNNLVEGSEAHTAVTERARLINMNFTADTKKNKFMRNIKGKNNRNITFSVNGELILVTISKGNTTIVNNAELLDIEKRNNKRFYLKLGWIEGKTSTNTKTKALCDRHVYYKDCSNIEDVKQFAKIWFGNELKSERRRMIQDLATMIAESKQ